LDKLNIFKGKKVLVTGSSGFKGSWLCMWLMKLGAEVHGISLEPKSELDNFNICGLRDRIHQMYCDVRYKDLVDTVISDINPEIIFHLAAQPIVLESLVDPTTTLDTNIMGTINVLEAARKLENLKTIVVVTSDKCYKASESLEEALMEVDPLGGKDPYSASKACEDIIATSYYESFFKDKGVGLSTARAGNVIGGGDRQENRIIPDCVRSIENAVEIEIRNPAHIRPWQYVLEPLFGYLKLASLMYTNPPRYSSAWNFGPGVESHLSVGELVRKLLDVLPGSATRVDVAPSKARTNPRKNKETKILSLNSERATNLLGVRNLLSIDDTIRFTVEDYFHDGVFYDQRMKRIGEFEKLTGEKWS